MSKDRQRRSPKTRVKHWVLEVVAMAVARRVIRTIIRKL